MYDPGLRRVLPDQFSGSGHTFGTPRHPSVTNPILSKRVCFYKSGDPQFNGLRMVINNRTFKTFDALLDSLSKKVPLPFGVRNITTPRGVHAVYSLEELEDGKSYICSDSRKVKPINLAVARKKPPPWYHASPVSSRRRTVQQARLYPGHKKQEEVVMRSPKKLLVIRNGDPSVKHTVVLQKRTTTTFESILGYISELMQFNVAKLHTPEGRRVDGLPGLIMCSGIVVAAGREKFKPANYNAQKAVGPMRSNRMGIRRLKALNRKKKPRIFSPSSERYIVNQIHTSIAEGSYSNSIEMESSRYLESVAESEAEHFGKEDQDCLLPQDDDIEKSFRVNQDGSMTVEMRVRLTIKEEETIHWTTTLSRSSVANELSEDCLPVPEPEQEISQLESDQMDLQPPTATGDAINKNQNDSYPSSLSNGAYSSLEEDNMDRDLVSPLRTPTPKLVRTKQATVESIKSLTPDGLQEDIIGTYREQIENGDLTEQYCMVKQTSSKPVPKPRRVGSVDANNTQNISTYKSAEMTEVLQVDSSGDEVTETVMHIYEQQTCQDNFLANFCAQGMSTSAVTYCRPATAKTGQHSPNSDFEVEPCRPSTASESVSIWRSESISLKSDLTFPSHDTAPLQTINMEPLSHESTKIQSKTKAKVVTKEIKSSPKHKGPIKFGTRLKSPKNKQKDTSKSKKVKNFSSARFITKIYGNKPKSPKQKFKKRQNKIEGNKAKSQQEADQNKNGFSGSEPRGVLTRQTSMHQDKQEQNDSFNLNESTPLPMSPNVGTNGYVEDWLEKAVSKPTIYPEEESKSMLDKIALENDPCLMTVAEKVNSLKEKSQTQNSTTALAPEVSRTGSVKQRIKSFENQSTEDKSHTVTDRRKNSVTSNLNGSCYKTNQKESDIDNKTASIIVQFEENSNALSMDLPPPPPAESLCTIEHVMEVSGTSSPLYRLSSVSDIHPLSTSPTSDKAISPTDHTMEMASSIYPDNPSELGEAPLQRAPSIKRAPLVSNLSLERKMSLKKASLDKYTIPTETTTLPINTMGENVLPNGLTGTQQAQVERLQSNSCFVSPSCTSASPASLSSDQRESSTSVLSSEAQQKQSNEKELSSPKPTFKKVKLVGSPSPERKPPKKKSEMNKSSPRLPSKNGNPPDKNASPNVGRKKSTTPSASPTSEKKQILQKSKLLNKPSPYSQSLDLASPPVKQKISKKSLQRNLSSDSALETLDTKTQRKSSFPKKSKQTLQSTESVKSKLNEKAEIIDTSIAMRNAPTEVNKEMAIKAILQPLKTSNKPNMKPMLEKLCYSIKTIRQITQNKRHSCLEKSNSLPDFSSHVASTFGSSSKALLAFLSVMTLKEGMPKLDVDELNANNVSCAEALKMIDSLKEIASIEESQNIHNSLSHLRQSASQQLLQSWRGFQEKCKSRGTSPNTSAQEGFKSSSPEQVEEIVIDEIMDHLKMPAILKEELASFSIGRSDCEESMTEIDIENILDVTLSAVENRNVNVIAINNPERHRDKEANQLQGLSIESPIDMSGANNVADQKQNILEQQTDEDMLDPHCYVELNVIKDSPSCPTSESEPANASHSGKKQQMYTMGVNGSVDETTTTTDMDEPPSSDSEQLDVSNELKIIIEETLSDEEQEVGVTKMGNYNKVNLEGDSGNDHSSCDEHTDIDPTNNDKKTSNKESFDEKEISSEEETFVMERYSSKESYQPVKLSEDEKIENIAKKLCDEVISHSIAERVICLEKKVANGHRRSSSLLSPLQKNAYLMSDGEESSTESPMSQLTPCTRSAPQSSLSFSYDSSNVITKQPESNRVRSIREMFLAKSATDIQNQQGQKQNSSPNPPDITDLRTETSISGGYQSQTSSELSSSEDDSSRKSISKGFVRRTIERLYGKKDSPAQVDSSDRPPSAHKDKKKEQMTSTFSPFHSAKSKTISELSYFNSSNALDTLNEATRCIAFNAQVGPGDSVAIDDGRWLLQENTALRKSVSDPVAINKKMQPSRSTQEEEMKRTEEKTPYSLFKTDSEDDQKSKKCTYFSLPHASDSEAAQEEVVGKSGTNVDCLVEPKDNPEGNKKKAERNGKLPGMVVTEFKMTDNKVHPLVEVPPAGEVVVVQPHRGQGAVNRRLQEPDMLDLLYNFCGERCPIL